MDRRIRQEVEARKSTSPGGETAVAPAALAYMELYDSDKVSMTVASQSIHQRGRKRRRIYKKSDDEDDEEEDNDHEDTYCLWSSS